MPLASQLLRFEPPVQYLPNRAALQDITIGGTTIPKGSPPTLLLAAADRDLPAQPRAARPEPPPGRLPRAPENLDGN